MRRMHSPPSASTRVSIRSIRPDSLTVRCSSMPSGHPPTSAPIRRTSVFRSIGCMPGTALYASSMSRTSKRAANSRSHSAPANAPMLKLLEFLQDTFPDRRRCAQSNRRCCAGHLPRTRPYGWPHSGSGCRLWHSDQAFALIDGIKPCRDSLDAAFRAGRGVQASVANAWALWERWSSLPRCLAAQPHG